MKRWNLISLVILLVAGCGGDGSDSSPTEEFDTTPPARISDLWARVQDESTAVLTWTAPGDDDRARTADRYDLRWSSGSLTDETWASAPRCDGLPEPREAGTSETHVLTDLPRAEPVRLGLKAIDEAGNASGISNVVTMRLPAAAPACSLSAEGLSFGSIAPHETVDRSFTLTNIAGGRLAGTVGIVGERFSLMDGAGAFSLGYREARMVTVRFAPGISGPAEGALTLGLDDCGPLPCVGQGTGPYCVMDWDTVSFGNVNVGDHGEWRITLTNHGDSWTTVTPQLEGCTGMRVPYDQPFTLQPGQSRSLGVEFWPQTDGPVDCRLKLNAQGECDEVTLLGRGIGPICVSTEHVIFDPIAVGASASWTYILKNYGGGILEGTVSLSCPDFAITSGAGPYRFGPNEGRTVRVRFAPQTPGEKSCTLALGSQYCTDVLLSGTALGPECVIEPDTLDFGDIQVGGSTERDLSIRNTGFGVLTGSVSLSCGEFSISSGGGSYSLRQEESRTVRVRFAPTTAGSKSCTVQTGSLCSGVTLHGSGFGEFCHVEPSDLDFGAVPVGQHVDRLVTISNTGGGTLTGSVWIDCPGFSIIAGGGDFALAPSAERQVTVRFAPTSGGQQTCDLQIGGSQCSAVPCQAVGIGAICAVIPPVVAFGRVPLGATVDSTVTVTNIGYAPILGTTTLTGDPEFSLLAGGGPIWLNPGQSRDFLVRFQPETEGEPSSTLQVGSCPLVPITGEGFDPPPVCTVSVDMLAFGVETIGDHDPQAGFSIRNTGGHVLEGSVSLASPDFELVSGGGPFRLGRDEGRVVWLRFAPTTVGPRTGVVDLGLPACPQVACAGIGVSYRILAEMSSIDDTARLSVNEGHPTYTAWYGRSGTDRTGWEAIGHYPGTSGVIDVTSDLTIGENRLRFTLENEAGGASVRIQVWKDSSELFTDEFHDGSAPHGIRYDHTFELETRVE